MKRINKFHDSFMLISFGRYHSLNKINNSIKLKKFNFEICLDKEKLIYNKFAKQYILKN